MLEILTVRGNNQNSTLCWEERLVHHFGNNFGIFLWREITVHLLYDVAIPFLGILSPPKMEANMFTKDF